MSTQPTPADLDPAAVSDLSDRLTGRVVDRSHEEWDAARTPWNLAVDQRPALVVEPANASDIEATVRFAGANGLCVAPQGTGHSAAPLGDLSATILVRTHQMRTVDLDLGNQVVRVGAGAIWQDVTTALEPHGLVARAGSSPDVGVVGYTVGGGSSWLARQHGLASSAVTAVELVTGDGQLRRVDAEHDPELFWAIRGGGGNVGIVCALEFEVLPIRSVYAGSLMFPLEQAGEVLSAYADWTEDLDERATTCVRLLRLPPLPDLPEFLRGQEFAVIDGAVLGDPDEAADLLAPLRALGPAIDSFAGMPASALGAIHMDPPQPVPAAGDGISLEDLTAETIVALLEVAGPGVDSSLLAVDIRHAGGAVGRPDPRGGALDHLSGRFHLFAVGIAMNPQMAGQVEEELAVVRAALAPWSADRDFINFRESRVQPEQLYPSPTLDRLRAVRAAFDPDGVVRGNHPVS